jgi:hypothetical protein
MIVTGSRLSLDGGYFSWKEKRKEGNKVEEKGVGSIIEEFRH